MTRFRLPRRWAQAAVVFAAASIGQSMALADPYGHECRGYCTVDSCETCDDESWWERTCGFCRERTDRFRSLRRRWYWKNNDRHITTMYPEMSPLYSPTYGYFQTCWRPFPYECPRCPQYVTTPASSPAAYPSSAPPMELAPPTDAARPGVTPDAKEPYFPQPAVPPASETILPPPEMFEEDAALPLGFRALPPVQEVFTNDGWIPRGLQPVHTAGYGFVSED